MSHDLEQFNCELLRLLDKKILTDSLDRCEEQELRSAVWCLDGTARSAGINLLSALENGMTLVEVFALIRERQQHKLNLNQAS